MTERLLRMDSVHRIRPLSSAQDTLNRIKHVYSRPVKYLKHARNAITRKKRSPDSFTDLRRTLTLPLPIEEDEELVLCTPKQITIEQVDSKLCTMLPYEVRSLIFEFAVARDENVVHVFKNGKKGIAHWKCRKQKDGQPCNWTDPCSNSLPFKAMVLNELGVIVSGDTSQQRYFDRSRIEPPVKGYRALSLLLTCRQIYTESIHLLYTKTHFHFPALTDILELSRTTLPERFDEIWLLSIDWEPNPYFVFSTPQMRVAAWNAISEMKGLQELRVFVKTLCTLPGCTAAQGLQRNMMKVKGLKVYELIVTEDLFPTFKGFLEEGNEAKLVARTDGRPKGGVMPHVMRLVRAY